MVVGALIVKHVENLSDKKTIQVIQENPYMQYLLGLPCFTEKPVFVPELFVLVRKRLDEKFFNMLTMMLSEADGSKPKAEDTDDEGHERGEPFEVKNLRVDGIAFRPEKRFKEDVQENINFRYDPQIKGQFVPEDYYEPLFTEFFSSPNNLLSRADVRHLLGIEDYPAKRLLQKLVADGYLIPVGGRGAARYLPAPGHFGR